MEINFIIIIIFTNHFKILQKCLNSLCMFQCKFNHHFSFPQAPLSLERLPTGALRRWMQAGDPMQDEDCTLARLLFLLLVIAVQLFITIYFYLFVSFIRLFIHAFIRSRNVFIYLWVCVCNHLQYYFLRDLRKMAGRVQPTISSKSCKFPSEGLHPLNEKKISTTVDRTKIKSLKRLELKSNSLFKTILE